MNHIFRSFLLVFLVLGSCLPITVKGQQPRRVLLLHSYQGGMTWVDDISAGVQEVLGRERSRVHLQVDYMDTKHHSSPAYLEMLHELFRVRYQSVVFDAIITADDDAFNFARKHREELFHGAPIVFCGVNDYWPGMLEGQADITGVAERGDILSTLQLVLQLHPDVRRLAIITDISEAGRTAKGEIERARGDLRRPVEFVFLDSPPLSAIADRLTGLSLDSAVYLGPYTVDLEKEGLEAETVLRTLRADRLSIPIYATNPTYLEKGAVGGYLVYGRTHGKVAAELAMRVVKGEKAGSIPVVTMTPGAPTFDYPQLKRFGISLDQLPAGSIVVRQQFSLYDEYRNWVWGTVAFVACQTLLVLVLMLNIRSRKRAQEKVRASESKYRALTSSLPEMVLELDREGKVTFINHAGLVRLEYRAEDLKGGLTIFDFVAPTDRNRVREYLAGNLRESEGRLEISMAAKDGYTFPSIMCMNTVFERGEVRGYRGLCFDISERKSAEEKLRTLHDELERRVRERTQELERANAELKNEIEEKRQTEMELLESRKDLRRIASHLETIREEENRRIAREIHDQLGTSLTAAKVELSFLEKAGKAELKERVASMHSCLDTLTDDVRQIARNLRPALLDDFGLKGAIEWFCTDFRQRTGVRCSVSFPNDKVDCGDAAATALFRILQEALTNVTRHAGATQVNVRVSSEEEMILLEIRDNGVGIQPSQTCGDTLGILGMQERAVRLRGSFSITRIAEGGTMVAARIPVRV